MPHDGPPGEPPVVEVAVEQDHGIHRSPQGYLGLHCYALRRSLPDGGSSEVFRYDVVERKHLDAVVIVLHRERHGQTEVCLRSQLRVPLVFRGDQDVPDPGSERAVLWEVPAGLIETGERGLSGIRNRARAEALEEAGYELAPERFEPLGPPCFPSPGIVAEKYHYVHAELTESDVARPPEGDGHPLERGAVIRFVPLAQALAAADAGQLPDMKTELALRRLSARGGGP